MKDMCDRGSAPQTTRDWGAPRISVTYDWNRDLRYSRTHTRSKSNKEIHYERTAYETTKWVV